MESREDSGILRPQPRRPGPNFSLTPISTNTSTPDPSPNSSQFDSLSSELRELQSSQNGGTGESTAADDRKDDADLSTGSGTAPQKTRSILNLTSSTLFGIYSPTGYDVNREEPVTPWGTGTQTPAGNPSMDMRSSKYAPSSEADSISEKVAMGKERRQERQPNTRQHSGFTGRRSAAARYTALLGRTILLFVLGVAYGEVIAHLHDARNLTPVRVDRINRASWQYLGFWGIAGVLLGGLLPWVDTFGPAGHSAEHQEPNTSHPDQKSNPEDVSRHGDENSPSRASLGADWNPIVRSIGAFVGIAFAIRKLPWQSTLQVSLTLALANPMMWYLIDRTRAGFLGAMSCGTLGAAILLSINPEWIPSPATAPTHSAPPLSTSNLLKSLNNGETGNSTTEVMEDILLGLVSYESIGVATWISSVLFCSCIFFGNVGRRLTLKPQ